jgi:hypothetical protein
VCVHRERERTPFIHYSYHRQPQCFAPPSDNGSRIHRRGWTVNRSPR